MNTDIAISFYLPRLSWEGLDNLHSFALEKIIDRARAFGSWLDDTCCTEKLRRCRLAVGDLRDAGLPQFPVVGWSNSDIAAALQSCTVLSYVLRDQRAGEFVDKLVLLLVAAAGVRLRANERS